MPPFRGLIKNGATDLSSTANPVGLVPGSPNDVND